MDNRQFHFISGLPRSGSTMLAALLAQNPSFHAPGTSAAPALFGALMAQINSGSETAVLLDEDQRRSVLRSTLESVHCNAGEVSTVFDTGRGWLARVDTLADLFPQCQFLVCVRRPEDVLNSLEHLFRENPVLRSKLFQDNTTTEQRIERLMANDGLVGRALALVKDCLTSPHSGRMIVIDYDFLLDRPAFVLRQLYALLREPEYTHDLENLSFDLPELDRHLNTPGLHRISGPLRKSARPPFLASHISKSAATQDWWNRFPETEATLLVERGASSNDS